MLKSMIEKQINITAHEMEQIVRVSKRKLLELEVLLAHAETQTGSFDTFRSAKELVRKVK